jgi:multimeric flavodoxin WrbA
MQVLLVNGSPHKNGCTNEALTVIADTLKENDIGSRVYWIGNTPIGGCIGCYGCSGKGRCVFDDAVNEFTDMAAEYDGFIFGSPVYYSGMNGSLMSLMDRVFFSASSRDPHPFRLKPAAAVVSARRAGTTSAVDQINKYFLHQQMPIISSRYWNMVHGENAAEVRRDEEGVQIMRCLGENMSWFLRLREAGEKAGVPLPKQEKKRISTNFIR